MAIHPLYPRASGDEQAESRMEEREGGKGTRSIRKRKRMSAEKVNERKRKRGTGRKEGGREWCGEWLVN